MIKAIILKIEKQKSKYGDIFYYVFLKGRDDGKPYKSCVFPKMGNFVRWQSLLKPGTILDNLRIKAGNLIDADSFPKKVGFEELVKPGIQEK